MNELVQFVTCCFWKQFRIFERRVASERKLQIRALVYKIWFAKFIFHLGKLRLNVLDHVTLGQVRAKSCFQENCTFELVSISELNRTDNTPSSIDCII